MIFVKLVVGRDKITFLGQETSWDQLPVMVGEVPDRQHTVLELAMASEDLSVGHANRAKSKAFTLVEQYRFEYLSDVGIQPLGSGPSPNQRIPIGDE